MKKKSNLLGIETHSSSLSSLSLYAYVYLYVRAFLLFNNNNTIVTFTLLNNLFKSKVSKTTTKSNKQTKATSHTQAGNNPDSWGVTGT